MAEAQGRPVWGSHLRDEVGQMTGRRGRGRRTAGRGNRSVRDMLQELKETEPRKCGRRRPVRDKHGQELVSSPEPREPSDRF